MLPRYIDVEDNMPKTLSQKVEKNKLRAQARTDLSLLWDRDRTGVKVTR